MIELFVMEYMTALGMTMVLLFLDSQYPRHSTIPAVYGTMIVAMVAVAIIYWEAGMETIVRIYPLIVNTPAFLLLLKLSRFRGWRLIFQLFSIILFCALIQHGTGLVYYLSGGNVWICILAYVGLTAAVIWFLLRFLRPLFFQALLELQRGWWLMCLVLAAYYVIIIYLIPGYVGSTRSSTILKPAISLLMVGFYSILMFLFSSIQKESEARHNAQLSGLQLSALQSRMEAVHVAENAIRTERHDLRHRLQTVSELIARGEKDLALDFLDSSQRRLDEQKEIRWCRPPILDAVFSSYFEQAQLQNIRVEATLSLPDTLPVDEAELAVVLANALENAIHANMKLPDKQRQICCKMVGTPTLLLNISNPYVGEIALDHEGFPISHQEGHGLGMQSISAFCRKHGAVCQFKLTDGWFRLMLVL